MYSINPLPFKSIETFFLPNSVPKHFSLFSKVTNGGLLSGMFGSFCHIFFFVEVLEVAVLKMVIFTLLKMSFWLCTARGKNVYSSAQENRLHSGRGECLLPQ